MRYHIRKVAGIYWLTDIEQSVWDYKRPLKLNEIGYEIWKRLSNGLSEEEAALELTEIYETDKTQILNDIKDFKKELRKNGIEL